jgi:hypothetical protein
MKRRQRPRRNLYRQLPMSTTLRGCVPRKRRAKPRRPKFLPGQRMLFDA